MLFDPVYYNPTPINLPPIPAIVLPDLPKIQELVAQKNTPKEPTPITSSEEALKPYDTGTSYLNSTYSRGESERYKSSNILYSPFKNMEDIYASQQTTGEKIGNAWKGFNAIVGDQVGLGLETLYSAISEGDVSKLWSNEFTSDLATTMENLDTKFPIYISEREQKEGLDFSTWMIKNSSQAGFTVGAIGDVILTDAAITLAASAMGLLEGGPVGALAEGTLGAAAGLVRSGARGYQIVRDLAKLASTGTKLSEAMNIARASSNAVGYVRTMATLANVGKASKFLIRGALASSGEAALERETYFREAQKNYIADFRSQHGFAPSEQNMEEVRKKISYGANQVYAENLAILTASNMLQFPSMLKGSIGSAFIKDVPILFKKELGKLVAQGLNKRAFAVGLGKEFIKDFITEGAEEWSQDIIREHTISYYRDIYNGRKQTANRIDEVYNSITKNLSDKGLDTFLSGAVLGGLFGGMGAVTDYTGVRIPFTKGTRFEKYGTIKSSASSLAKQYSEMINKNGLLFNGVVRQLNIENKINQAVSSQDSFKLNNAIHESLHNYVVTALKTGTYDEHIENLKDLHGLDLGEFTKMVTGLDEQALEQQGITFTESDKKAYIDKLVNRAQQVKQTYKAVASAYGINPYMEETIKKIQADGYTKQQANNIANNLWEDYKYTVSLSLSSAENLKTRKNSMVDQILTRLDAKTLEILIEPNVKESYIKSLKEELQGIKGSVLPSDVIRSVEIMSELQDIASKQPSDIFDKLTEDLTLDEKVMVNDIARATYVMDKLYKGNNLETIHNQKKRFNDHVQSFRNLDKREVKARPNPDNPNETIVNNGVSDQIVPNNQVDQVVDNMENNQDQPRVLSANEEQFATEQNLSDREKQLINLLINQNLLTIEC